MDAFDLSTLSHIVPSLQVRSLWLSNDARRQLGAGQEEIVQEVGANFSCAHFNYFLSSTWFVHSSQQFSPLGVLSNSVREGVESA